MEYAMAASKKATAKAPETPETRKAPSQIKKIEARFLKLKVSDAGIIRPGEVVTLDVKEFEDRRKRGEVEAV
jgi:hypothetical protein